MYTNQFLWTAARENLDLVAVIFSNRQYNILEVEYRRLGVNEIGDKAGQHVRPVPSGSRLGGPGARPGGCGIPGERPARSSMRAYRAPWRLAGRI